MTARIAVAVAALAALSSLLPAQQPQVSKPPTLDELEAAARADSNDPVAHYNVAAVYVDARRYAEAEPSLRQAVDVDPQYAPALLLLSRVIESRSGQSPIFAVLSGRRIMFVGRRNDTDGEAARLRRRAFLIDPLLEAGAAEPQRPAREVARDAESSLTRVRTGALAPCDRDSAIGD